MLIEKAISELKKEWTSQDCVVVIKGFVLFHIHQHKKVHHINVYSKEYYIGLVKIYV